MSLHTLLPMLSGNTIQALLSFLIKLNQNKSYQLRYNLTLFPQYQNLIIKSFINTRTVSIDSQCRVSHAGQVRWSEGTAMVMERRPNRS